MRVTQINQNNKSFGMKFKLSPATIKAVESSTGLTYDEMTRLPLDECSKLMKERGTLKEPSRFKQWLSAKYKEFGERFGLLKKEYNFYTDVD